MRLGLIWASTYGRDMAILALAAALGYPAVKPLVSGGVRLPLAILTGLGGLSLMIGILSWLHLFTTGTMIGVAGVSAVLCGVTTVARRRDHRYIRAQVTRSWVASYAPYLAIVVPVGLLSVLALYPATAFDSIMYHLPLARDLVTHHGFTYDAFVRFSFLPQANEALFALTFLLSPNPIVSQGLELCILGLCLWLVLAYFRDVGGLRSAGFAASLVILASPVVISTATTAYIDIWPMAFLLAGIVLAVLKLQGRTNRSPLCWALVGFLLAQAAAGKYTGLADAAVISFVLVLAVVRWPPRRRQLRSVALAALGFLIVVAPWYLRPLSLTGDPTYPFLTNVFGNQNGPYTTRELAALSQSVRDTARPGVLGIVGRDIKYAVGEVPGGGTSGVPAGIPPLTVLLGTGLLGLAMRPLRHDRVYRVVILSGVGMVAVWVLTSADQRYTVPAVGVLALAAGMTVDQLLRTPARVLAQRVRAVAAVAVAAVALYRSVEFAKVTISYFGLPPASGHDTAAYLDASGLGCLPGVEYLNARFGSNYSAYALHCEQTTFYAEGRYMGDWFGRASYFRVLGPTAAVSSIPRLVNNLGALRPQFFIASSSDLAKPQLLTASGRLRMVFHGDDTFVFQLER
jgi:hypothetical protein